MIFTRNFILLSSSSDRYISGVLGLIDRGA